MVSETAFTDSIAIENSGVHECAPRDVVHPAVGLTGIPQRGGLNIHVVVDIGVQNCTKRMDVHAAAFLEHAEPATPGIQGPINN